LEVEASSTLFFNCGLCDSVIGFTPLISKADHYIYWADTLVSGR
jgi:hypothetical protein